MGNIIWLVIMIPTSMLFTGIGIYAWRRKKPMWFYSGSTVGENEIEDIPRYNRANGIMWLVFSFVFWISTILGLFNMAAGGIFAAGFIIAYLVMLFIVGPYATIIQSRACGLLYNLY